MNWFIRIFRGLDSEALSVGTRITTKWGRGTVVSGNVIVLYDNNLKFPKKAQGANNRTWTHSLKELSK